MIRPLLIALLLSTAAQAQDDAIPEDSYGDVDLCFVNSANDPGLPSSYTYTVHDRNSRRLLLVQTLVNAPTANSPARCVGGTERCSGNGDCPSRCVGGVKKHQLCAVNGECPSSTCGATCASPAGCNTVRLQASTNPYVGSCSGPAGSQPRSCTQNSHCTPHTCIRPPNEQSQVHVLSGVANPGPDQASFRVEVEVLNLEFIPLQ